MIVITRISNNIHTQYLYIYINTSHVHKQSQAMYILVIVIVFSYICMCFPLLRGKDLQTINITIFKTNIHMMAIWIVLLLNVIGRFN